MALQRGLLQGRRSDTNALVEGYYVHMTEGDLDVIIGLDGQFNKININTLRECAGAYDKNGKLLYEYDAVRHTADGSTGVIRYGEYRQPFNDDKWTKHIGFYVEWADDSDARKDLGYWLPYIEVIGNTLDEKNKALKKGNDDE